MMIDIDKNGTYRYCRTIATVDDNKNFLVLLSCFCYFDIVEEFIVFYGVVYRYSTTQIAKYRSIGDSR